MEELGDMEVELHNQNWNNSPQISKSEEKVIKYDLLKGNGGQAI